MPMRDAIHPTVSEFEHRIFQRIRLFSRAVVVSNWAVVLAMLVLNRIPKPVALAAFTVFRVTAVCATLWLLFETAEAFTGRTSIKNPLIDAILILPMFGFWFLAWASSF
jgi:hypothetical protein